MMVQDALPGLAKIKAPSKNTAMDFTTATEKQTAFILSLSETRNVMYGAKGLVTNQHITEIKDGKSISRQVASQMIDYLLAAPKISIPQTTAATSIEPGFYRVLDRTLKAVRSPQTGNMYAKELLPTGWEYLTGGINLLKKNEYTKLTLDEAKELGKLYGFCIKCGRTLTDEISISNGIGPICAESF